MESNEDSHRNLMNSDFEGNHPRINVYVNSRILDRKPRAFRYRLVWVLIAVAAALSLANVIVTIVVVVQQNSDTSSGEKQVLNFTGGVCVPCIKLILDPYEPMKSDPLLDKLDKKLDNGVQMCCAYSSDQLSVMLECGMREQVTRPTPAPPSNSSSLKFVPASVHKRLFPPAVDMKSNTGHIHMRLRNFSDPTEHFRGVELEEDAIKIRYTGLYYIYISMHFKIDQSVPLSVYNQSVFQYVERISPNSPRNSGLLLQNAHTLCRDCSKREETAFTGGVFYLKGGDKLRVCVTEAAAHAHTTDMSNIGLMMLASGKKGGDTGTV